MHSPFFFGLWILKNTTFNLHKCCSQIYTIVYDYRKVNTWVVLKLGNTLFLLTAWLKIRTVWRILYTIAGWHIYLSADSSSLWLWAQWNTTRHLSSLNLALMSVECPTLKTYKHACHCLGSKFKDTLSKQKYCKRLCTSSLYLNTVFDACYISLRFCSVLKLRKAGSKCICKNT